MRIRQAVTERSECWAVMRLRWCDQSKRGFQRIEKVDEELRLPYDSILYDSFYCYITSDVTEAEACQTLGTWLYV
ncbi:hypothetical protein NDU88_004772 [Pleurodeles waltl]|uniref:Uncharacterized protein n=1 Tax=Pleurodeles waltl TaxID=8319 RepID=A0AAV7PHN6_PLEWA|nr:hypothetical protein NDU88_004772 [Pleurodeles waltl]